MCIFSYQYGAVSILNIYSLFTRNHEVVNHHQYYQQPTMINPLIVILIGPVAPPDRMTRIV
jgi:hypothetical protein